MTQEDPEVDMTVRFLNSDTEKKQKGEAVHILE